MDIIEPWGTGGKYSPDTARQILTMVPMWGLYAAPAEEEPLRRLIEIYHYLLREGVAGRWSYVFHPKVEGDTEFYYFQRTSHDRTRACVILKHRAPGRVVIFPRGLLPAHDYVVGFDSTRETTTRTGADLMAQGIVIQDQKPGELVYLGLPGRPGGGQDLVPPVPPGRVLARRETNLGHTGVGVYWSPGRDDHWISYYEVRRGNHVLGKASAGCYYFDHSAGWDPQASYAVRTVDGDGNASTWAGAVPTANEPLAFSALGGHFAESGREGWLAETTSDAHTFAPMAWIAARQNARRRYGRNAQSSGRRRGLLGRVRHRARRAGLAAKFERCGVRAHLDRAGQRHGPRHRARDQGMVSPGEGRHSCESEFSTELNRSGQRKARPTVPPNDLVGAVHDFTLVVAAGDAVRFVLEQGAVPEDEIIAWMPRIIYADTSQPAVWRKCPHPVRDGRSLHRRLRQCVVGGSLFRWR